MEKSIYKPEYGALLELLKQARQEAGLTQVELAERLSLTQSMLSKMERGELRIDIVQLRTICQALDFPLTDFVDRWERELAEE